MANTDKLKDMLDNIVNDKPTEAEIDFSSYLKDKVRDHLGTNSAEADETSATE